MATRAIVVLLGTSQIVQPAIFVEPIVTPATLSQTVSPVLPFSTVTAKSEATISTLVLATVSYVPSTVSAVSIKPLVQPVNKAMEST